MEQFSAFEQIHWSKNNWEYFVYANGFSFPNFDFLKIKQTPNYEQPDRFPAIHPSRHS